MAEGKKSFIAYCDWKDIFEELSDVKAGKLAKHLFRYVNDQKPETKDQLVKLCFIPIKQTLKRDLKKFKDVKNKKSEAAKLGNLKRWHKDLYDKLKAKKLTLEDALNIAESRKASHSDNFIANIADSDSVNDSDSDIINNYNKWVNEISNEQMYLDGVYMSYQLEKGSVSKLFESFINHLKANPENHKNKREFKKHFYNWVGTKDRNNTLTKYKKQSKGSL